MPCGSSDYQVVTKRVNTIAVEDDPAADGSVTVADNIDSQSNDVSFVIAIP